MKLKTNSGTILILIICFVVTAAIASYPKQQTHLPSSPTTNQSPKSQLSNSDISLDPTNVNIDNDLQLDNSEQPVQQQNVESAANVLLEQINENSNLTLNDNNSSVPDKRQQLKFQQQDSEDGQVENLGPLTSGFAEVASSSIPANLQENLQLVSGNDKKGNNHVSNSLKEEMNQPLDGTRSNHILPLHFDKYKSTASGTAKGLRTARNSINSGDETNDDEIDDTIGDTQQTKLAARQDDIIVPNVGPNFGDLNAAAGHHYKKKKKKKKILIKKKKKKVKIVKKVKKKKKVYVTKKVKKVKKHTKKKKKKHHSVKHHHGGGGGGYGKYYM